MPNSVHNDRLAFDTGSPRTNPVVRNPNRAPAQAVANRWLDHVPPNVTRWLLLSRRASCSIYFSFRHLLTEIKGCIRSSRLMATLSCLSRKAGKSSGYTGLWTTKGYIRLFCKNSEFCLAFWLSLRHG